MTTGAAPDRSPYLTFVLAQEHYAIDIAKVREVLEFTQARRIPRAPPSVRGVINLRGQVVPVIDLRLQLGLDPAEPTLDTSVIITEVVLDGATLVLGAIADAVQEVIELDAAAIAPPPRMGARADTRFIRGLYHHEDRLLMLLDLERALSDEDLRAAAGAQVPGAEAPGQPG
ncbi:MAG: chemotaxis protein CheW [Anaeromyxobacter sp.]